MYQIELDLLQILKFFYDFYFGLLSVERYFFHVGFQLLLIFQYLKFVSSLFDVCGAKMVFGLTCTVLCFYTSYFLCFEGPANTLIYHK